MNSGQKSTMEPIMEPNAKEAATAVWFVQFPEDSTKTTTWQKFLLFIIGAWQLILRAWVSCHTRWSTWDRFGSGPRVSVQAAWLRLKSWLHVQAIWDSLNVPPTLRGWGLLTRVHRGWSMRWSRDFFVGIGYAGVVVFAYLILSSTIPSSDTSTSLTQRRHCYQIMRSFSMIGRFPFPYPVDDAAHKAILNGIGWTETEPLLSNLSDESSFVRSNLSGLLEKSYEIARHLAYLYLDSDITNLSLSSDIEDLLDRFHSTATPIKVSLGIYNDLEVLYRQQQNIAGEGFKRCQAQLDHSWHQTLMFHQSLALKWIGIDFIKWYGVPLQEASRIWEEARLGVAALDQESQRMKEIGYLIAEGRRILDQLATSLIQGDAQCENNVGRQERVQQWLEQAIVNHTILKEVWDEISMSN